MVFHHHFWRFFPGTWHQRAASATHQVDCGIVAAPKKVSATCDLLHGATCCILNSNSWTTGRVVLLGRWSKAFLHEDGPNSWSRLCWTHKTRVHQSSALAGNCAPCPWKWRVRKMSPEFSKVDDMLFLAFYLIFIFFHWSLMNSSICWYSHLLALPTRPPKQLHPIPGASQPSSSGSETLGSRCVWLTFLIWYLPIGSMSREMFILQNMFNISINHFFQDPFTKSPNM